MTDFPPSLNLADIQGPVINGYTHKYSAHMIFQFGEDSEPAEFIKAVYKHVQSAARWEKKPIHMLNVALSAKGIHKLKGFDIDPRTSAFGWSFCAGPASEGSQASLQDNGDSSPSGWLFGNDTPYPVADYEQIPIDCTVHVYGLTEQHLSTLVKMVADAATSARLTELFPIWDGNQYSKRLEQCQLPPGKIHFGYRDGMDNPDTHKTSTAKIHGKRYTDPQGLNNFLVGYNSKRSSSMPGPTGSSVEALFANNGFYCAFRMLRQDLAGFENFLDSQAEIIAPRLGKNVADAKEWLAAKLVGRWREGSPLALAPDANVTNLEKETNFTYRDDPNGLKCPIAAHTRVANPRDTEMTLADTPVPRILRRGVPYGPDDHKNDQGQSGLAGLFLVGNLGDQFEKVSGWMNKNNFTPSLAGQYPSSQDALLGNRQVGTTTQDFTIPLSLEPSAGYDREHSNVTVSLPQFIVTRGSAYTFFPSLSALKSCFS